MTKNSTPADSLPVPLLDISRGNEPLREEILAAIADVFDSGRFLYGPDVSQLEESVAKLCKVPHAVGCASGSDALLLSLMAFDIGRGDEVIVPSFTFFASASAVWRLGAKIVFADIDPVSFNIDPQHVESLITSRTKAIIPVHLFGQCADMDAIGQIAEKHNLRVIEDAAQSIGAELDGRPAGSMGDVGCFSFYPTKNLGGCGDGGMLSTRDAELDSRLRLLAAHGMRPRYFHQVVGINSRLDSFQAAALNVKLKRIDACTIGRQANASRYASQFREAGLATLLQLPQAGPNCKHVWNQYTIRVPDGRRDELREHMTRCRIGTEIYYPHPLHQQECFAEVECAAGSLPETEKAAAEVLCLPIFPGLTADEQSAVVRSIGDFFAASKASAA